MNKVYTQMSHVFLDVKRRDDIEVMEYNAYWRKECHEILLVVYLKTAANGFSRMLSQREDHSLNDLSKRRLLSKRRSLHWIFY